MKSFLKNTNNLFRIVVIFLAIYIWIRYIINSGFLSFVITILIVTAIEFLLKIKNTKKTAKMQKTAEQLVEQKNQLNTLCLSTKSQNIDFIYNMLQNSNNCTKNKSHIVLEKDNKKTLLYPIFQFSSLTIFDMEQIYKTTNNKPLIILTNKIEENAIIFANEIFSDILILQADECFKLFEKYNHFPKQTKLNKKKKTTFQEIIQYSLNKKRTKPYFISALFLILSSFLVPYKLFYLIFATILLCLAFFSHYNTKFNSNLPTDSVI